MARERYFQILSTVELEPAAKTKTAEGWRVEAEGKHRQAVIGDRDEKDGIHKSNQGEAGALRPNETTPQTTLRFGHKFTHERQRHRGTGEADQQESRAPQRGARCLTQQGTESVIRAADQRRGASQPERPAPPERRPAF